MHPEVVGSLILADVNGKTIHRNRQALKPKYDSSVLTRETVENSFTESEASLSEPTMTQEVPVETNTPQREELQPQSYQDAHQKKTLTRTYN